MMCSLRIILFLLMLNTAYAEHLISCPTVEEVKQSLFNHWLPLYIEGEELASQKDILQFTHDVKTFLAAQWDVTYLEQGHCFYEGGPMTQKIILAHDAWRPVDNPYWYWRNSKSAACTADPQSCSFIE